MSVRTIVLAIGIGVVAVVGGVLIGGQILPRNYRVQREVWVLAPPATVFEHVVDLERQAAWSPWKSADPTMVWTYGERRSGLGASYTWTSDNSGEGSYRLVAVEPTGHVESEVTFEGMGVANGWFDLQPDKDGTRITWGFKGSNDGLLAGYFSALMDDMIGPSFERGLADLKTRAEADASAQRDGQAEPR